MVVLVKTRWTRRPQVAGGQDTETPVQTMVMLLVGLVEELQNSQDFAGQQLVIATTRG